MAMTKILSPLKRIGANSAAPTKVKQSAGTPRTKRRSMIAVGIGLVIVVGVAIWIIVHFGRDNRMAELADLRARQLDPSISQQERQEIEDQIRRIQQSLIPEVQNKAADGFAAFIQLMSTHAKQVLSLPEDRRMAAIDRDIDNERSMGAMFGGRGNQQPNSQKDAAGRPGFWPGPQATDAQRNAFRNRMLSTLPAETRAAVQNYMQLMQARRIQRGM